MGAEHQLARAVLEDARRTFTDQVADLSVGEALDAAGGYRSILGIIKHAAGWSAVYRSYAFDPEPRHWNETEWPRRLRERIAPTTEYLDELRSWFDRSATEWIASVEGPIDTDEPRPVHWGGTAPLRDIVAMVAGHWTYHAGEINAILSIRRGEAWEFGEEVEENHIDTTGHRVRPGWMTDEDAARYERR